jgi:hypothetical protein
MWIDIKLNQPVFGQHVDIWRVPSIGDSISTGYRVCNQYYGKSMLADEIDKITHWMPVPEAPTAKAVETGATEAAAERQPCNTASIPCLSWHNGRHNQFCPIGVQCGSEPCLIARHQ